MLLDKRTVIVTGAAGGLGEGIARVCHREGANVVIADVRGEAANTVANSLGDRALSVACDVRNDQALDDLVAATVRKFGRVDGLVNNAGVNFAKPFLETSAGEWERVISVDLRAVFFLTQAVCRRMLAQSPKGGSIVNISSVHSQSVLAGSGPYDAAKWGVVGMAKSIAVELAEHDIRVNIISPGLLNTQIWQDIQSAAPNAFLGDSLEMLGRIPTGSVNLVFTSPPYALHFKKEYGNAHKRDYVRWFIPFATEILRVLRDDGSFVLNIGGSYNEGKPTRSLYHFHLLIALVEEVGFHLAQECFWYNPAKMPMPAEWVTVRRVRIKDSVEYVWWFSKTPWPKASNSRVLKEYSPDMIRLSRRGVKPTVRPSGHVIRDSFDKIAAGGAIPANVVDGELPELLDAPVPETMLKFGNNAANDEYAKRSKELGLKMHPARFPAALPEFFIRLLTEPGDTVIDPFAGSNTTGVVAENLRRRWIAMERVPEYLEASRVRFEPAVNPANSPNGQAQADLF